MTGTDRILTAMLAMKHRGCLLCRGPASVAAVWQPSSEHQEKVKAPDGKLRVIAYALCPACKALPDSEQRVEQRIIRTIAAAAICEAAIVALAPERN